MVFATIPDTDTGRTMLWLYGVLDDMAKKGFMSAGDTKLTPKGRGQYQTLRGSGFIPERAMLVDLLGSDACPIDFAGQITPDAFANGALQFAAGSFGEG